MICTTCKSSKSEEEFVKRNNLVTPMCLQCRRDYVKQWKLNHKEIYDERRRAYERARLKADPNYRMIRTIRDMIKRSLKTNTKRSGKLLKVEIILGCTVEEFREIIEKQFQPGMTWENHNRFGWHVDHKIPVSMGKSKEEILKLNHYSNLQPMWSTENHRKSNKLTTEEGSL